MITEHIDWTAAAEFAAGLSRTELHARIRSYQDGLDAADACDRQLGTDRGGLYRDQISVLRQEVARRSRRGVCSECGCKEHPEHALSH